MLALFARLATRRAWAVLAGCALVLAASALYGVGALKALSETVSPNPKSESTREEALVKKAFPNQQFALFILLGSNQVTVDDPAFADEAEPLLQTLRRDPSVALAYSYFESPVPSLVSKDRHATFVPVVLRGEGASLGEAYVRLKSALTSKQLRVRIGGVAAVGREIGDQLRGDIAASERVSFAILGVLLLFIFRSVVGALLPLVVGGLSIIVALAMTRLIGTFTDVTIYAANIITFLGLGLAIDYSLFILSRFREELDAGAEVRQAVETAMRTAGRTVAFSGSIVGLSLLGLLVFPRNFLYSMAIGGAAAVLASVVVSLTLLPALLTILGRRVNKGRVAIRRGSSEDASFWTRLSHGVMRRAGLVVVLVLGLLFIAGTPFLRVNLNTVDARTLPPSFESRQVTDELARTFNLLPRTPIEIALEMPHLLGGDAQRARLSDYVQRVQQVPDVVQVRSELNRNPISELPRTQGDVTTLDVEYRGDSQALATQRLVSALRNLQPPQGGRAFVGGPTADLVDLVDDISSHAPLALAIIVVATFLLLLLMLRSILVPIKAILFNALSLSAAFGGLVWVFQDGHLQGLLGFQATGALDANVPVLIFVIAFGLSVDYEVFLVSRMKEAYDAGATTTDSVAFGLERTGQIITSAALLLLVVIGAFTMGKLSVMKQLGFGLGLAILIDATLVRSLLVPATMKFLGNYNWWVPAGLGRLLDKMNLSH